MDINLKLNPADIIALIISVWALFIAYKNRRNVMRENIYNRQLNCFEEIQQRMIKAIDLVYKYQETDNKSIKVGLEVLHQENDNLYHYIEIKRLILPEDIFKNIEEFTEIISKSILEDKPIIIKNLMKKHVEIENDMRLFIGLDKLSAENRKLVE